MFEIGAGSVHLAELQHALAASCRATPRLRHAWLSNLAEHNARQGDYDEVHTLFSYLTVFIERKSIYSPRPGQNN